MNEVHYFALEQNCDTANVAHTNKSLKYMFVKILKRIGILFVFAFMALVVYRGVFVLIPKERTDTQVAKIHATRLSLVDVLGKNLPPTPSNPDATIAGVDANKNGIRDDVELAIFKEYPKSAKTRLPLLQYALVLQMQMTLPKINKETFTATVEDKDRALNCIWSISSRSDLKKFDEETTRNEVFVTSRQTNTEQRKKYLHDLYNYLGSYSSPNEGCDLDLSALPN